MRTRDDHSSRARAGRWALAAVGVAAMATSVGALADGPASSTSTIPGQSIGSSTATCKSHEGVVAGGFEVPSFGSGDDNAAGVARISSRRVGKRHVTTDAFNFGTQAGELTSLAYCSKAGKTIRVKSSSALVPPNTVASVVATCGRHSRVLGGGFEAPGFSEDQGPQIITVTSRRDGKRQWRVEGFNIPPDDSEGNGDDSQGQPGFLIAYAYCKKHGPKLKSGSQQVVVPAEGLSVVDAACPGRSKALSGGFDGNFQPAGNDASAAGAVGSKKVAGGHAWRISALSIADTTLATVTAYAYCRRP